MHSGRDQYLRYLTLGIPHFLSQTTNAPLTPNLTPTLYSLTTTTMANQSQPPTQNPFPAATSVAPVIFTPIHGDDLIAPFNPPTDRTSILNDKIATLNENAKQVKANIIALMRRECCRILWDARNQARQLREVGDAERVDEIGSERVTEEELEVMIERMTSEGGGNGSGRQVEIPNFDSLMRREGNSFREFYTLQIEATLSKGLVEIDGYQKEVEQLRSHYKDLLHKEWDRERMDLD